MRRTARSSARLILAARPSRPSPTARATSTDIEDKGNIAVVDAKTLAVTAHYDVSGKAGTCAGLALDAKNRILFAACREPHIMIILNADDGNIITTLPLAGVTDGAVFNPETMEAFSSHAEGTLTVIKEKSPTSFEV